MALVTFVNDSAPYLNAENLNNNFEYLDADNIYSTNETLTNKKWIDGKPIYRKVFKNTSSITITANSTIPFAIPNIDEVTFITGFFFLPTVNGWMPFPLIESNGENVMNCYYDISAQAIGFRGLGSWSFDNTNRKFRFVIEYTKTTD
jgi:hypothetical protein